MPSEPSATSAAKTPQEFEVYVLNLILGHLLEGTNPEPITGAIAREYRLALDAYAREREQAVWEGKAMDNEFEVFVLNQISGHLVDGTNPEPITGPIAREHRRVMADARAAIREATMLLTQLSTYYEHPLPQSWLALPAVVAALEGEHMSATTGYTGRALTPEERALAMRLHNEPENKDLGPCQCPICSPLWHIDEGGEA